MSQNAETPERVRPARSLVNINAVAAGDLVLTGFRGLPLLGVCIRPLPVAMLGIFPSLNGVVTHAPYWTELKNSLCVSYGSKWFIEPDEGSAVVSNEGSFKAGMLGLAEDGYHLLFPGESSNPMHAFTRNYFSLDHASIASSALPRFAFTRWSLWLSQADRDNPRGTPFLTFDASTLSAS